MFAGLLGQAAEVVARLNADFGRVVKAPDVQERYASLGVSTEHSTPEQVTERVKTDLQDFARILNREAKVPGNSSQFDFLDKYSSRD